MADENLKDKPKTGDHAEGKRPGDGSKPEAEVQAQVDKETEQGFRGVEVDPTPNENYTLQGVLDGKPTPETDRDHARQVRAHLEDVAAGNA